MLDSFFKNNDNLTQIRISNCILGNEGCRLLALAIGCCSKSLQAVMLTNNHIEEEEMVTVITSLRFNPQLKQIELFRSDLHKNGCLALATLLEYSTTRLQNLNLSSNQIDDDGIDILAPVLTKLSHLESLNLCQNTLVTARGWQRVATILAAPNTNLKYLKVDKNDGDQAAVVFADALTNNNTLRRLSLICTPMRTMTAKGWNAFSNLVCDTSSVNSTFRSNHTLSTLYVSENIQFEPPHLRASLELNEKNDKKVVPIVKVLKHHNDFDMKPFFEWEFKVLPLVIGWLERASAYTTDFDANIEERKLSSIYQFIRNMPVLYVESRLRNELEDILSEVSQMEEEERERKLRKQLLQERKKIIIEKLGVGK